MSALSVFRAILVIGVLAYLLILAGGSLELISGEPALLYGIFATAVIAVASIGCVVVQLALSIFRKRHNPHG